MISTEAWKLMVSAVSTTIAAVAVRDWCLAIPRRRQAQSAGRRSAQPSGIQPSAVGGRVQDIPRHQRRRGRSGRSRRNGRRRRAQAGGKGLSRAVLGPRRFCRSRQHRDPDGHLSPTDQSICRGAADGRSVQEGRQGSERCAGARRAVRRRGGAVGNCAGRRGTLEEIAPCSESLSLLLPRWP